jgi:hypothetical protein
MIVAEWCLFAAIMLPLLTLAPVKPWPADSSTMRTHAIRISTRSRPDGARLAHTSMDSRDSYVSSAWKPDASADSLSGMNAAIVPMTAARLGEIRWRLGIRVPVVADIPVD